MNAVDEAEMRRAFGPLVEALREGRGARVSARPGRVVVDHLEGARALEISWTAEHHAAAFKALAGGQQVVDGLAVMAVGDAVVVVRGPDANRRIDDLARDGVLSSLAARLIDAAVALGRNVVVAGPWLASVELIGAVTAGGTRPGILGGGALPLPATWVRASVPAELVAYGADRIGTWSADVDALARLLAATSGIVAWVDARRLDRALIRYEAAVDARAQAPLQVVAGIDLVVVLQGSKVREIAEITMAPDGYRPHLLFSTGMPPSPQALVPLAAPTFIDELAGAGFAVLADELRAIAPHVQPRDANDEYAKAVDRARAVASQIDSHDPEDVPQTRRPRSGPSGRQHDPLGIREALRPQGRPEIRPDLTAPEIPTAIVEALKHAPPPGWELDRLGEEDWVDDGSSASNAEDAAMAATFGLAPPPRPVGYKGEAVSFAELLKRTKDRDSGQDEDSALPSAPPEET